MREDAFQRDDPARVSLACAINHAHPPSPDLFQNFVMTEAPLRVSHIAFFKDPLERFPRSLAFGFKPSAQETVDARPVIMLRRRPAPLAFRRTGNHISD